MDENNEELNAMGATGEEEAEVESNGDEPIVSEEDELDEIAAGIGEESADIAEAGETNDEGETDPAVEGTVDLAQYRITGLVDYTDEQGNIRGQLDIGSVHELPIVVGDAAVADGRAERVE